MDDRSDTILLVDDRDEASSAIASGLRGEHAEFDVATLGDADVVGDVLEAERIDCVAVAHGPEAVDGLALFERVRGRDDPTPFLVLLTDPTRAVADEALDAGVTDVVWGGDASVVPALLNRVQHALERRRLRRELGEGYPRFETVIASLPGMVYRARVHDPWPMSYVGGRVEALTGYTEDEIESGDVAWGEDVVVEDDVREVENTIVGAVEAGEPFELRYEIVTKHGERKEVWERGEAIYDDGEPVALDGFITEQSAPERDG